MKKNYIQIAIDGPAGSGKSTIAKIIAKKLKITFLSTGKIFRSYAFACKDITDIKQIEKKIKHLLFNFKNNSFYINKINVTKQINNDNLSQKASKISTSPIVRQKYQNDVKKILEKHSIVMDGRDIGTAIIPNTKYKYFLTASIKERANRRAKELGIRIKSKNYQNIYNEIKKRDYQDKHRKFSPLKKAHDALLIDSSKMTIQDVVKIIIEDIRKKQNEKSRYNW